MTDFLLNQYPIITDQKGFVFSLPTFVPSWAVVMGVLVAMSVGLFFGMYPAVKAARLDPVETSRYE